MDGWKASKWVALLLLGAAAACAQPEVEEAVRGGSSKVTARAFDRNAVIDDKSLGDSDALSAADVQKLLDKTPWNKKSVLATYSENGKSAAEIMVEAAQKYKINPLELVTRAQMEQGLVYKTTAPAETIAKAFGCGCPDDGSCSATYKGFTAQADCAAGTLRRSMDKALTTGTVTGWKRSATKQSSDGLAVTPTNAATAALYTYTPWVGEYGGGKKGVGGVSLHFQVWNQMAEHAQYGAWATQTQSGEGEGEGAGEQPTDPPSDPPADPPTEDDPPASNDAGAADSAPRADSGTSPDAGPPRDGPPSTDTKTDTKGPPSDGSEDSEILGEGSTPPASNSGPVTSKNKTPTKPTELPTASEDELTSKKKTTEGGCATTASRGNASNALLVLAAAVALLGGRRRRNAA